MDNTLKPYIVKLFLELHEHCMHGEMNINLLLIYVPRICETIPIFICTEQLDW